MILHYQHWEQVASCLAFEEHLFGADRDTHFELLVHALVDSLRFLEKCRPCIVSQYVLTIFAQWNDFALGLTSSDERTTVHSRSCRMADASLIVWHPSLYFTIFLRYLLLRIADNNVIAQRTSSEYLGTVTFKSLALWRSIYILTSSGRED
jgi:hypothetical protein